VIPHFQIFNFLAICQVLQCAFLIFHGFQCFSPYSRSYSVRFHCPRFSIFCHIPSTTVCISHFQSFSVLLAIFQIQDCMSLIFQVFHFSRHIPCPTVCISHFPCFSVFRAIFQVFQCAFLIFHVFQFLLRYFRHYNVLFLFLKFLVFTPYPES
jgi:hypothetical protein